MRANETELAMVQRHVRDGRRHVARQRAIVAKFRAAKLPLELAERTLANLEAVQQEHEAHLSRLEAK